MKNLIYYYHSLINLVSVGLVLYVTWVMCGVGVDSLYIQTITTIGVIILFTLCFGAYIIFIFATTMLLKYVPFVVPPIIIGGLWFDGEMGGIIANPDNYLMMFACWLFGIINVVSHYFYTQKLKNTKSSDLDWWWNI